MSKKVTFTLSAETVNGATAGLLLGDFNNWNAENGTSLIKQKDGSMNISLDLEPGNTYQYRYLLNDGRWVNDNTAAQYAHAHGFEVENCVIEVPAVKAIKAAKENAPKEAKPAKEKVVKAIKEKSTKEAKETVSKAPKVSKQKANLDSKK